MNQTDAPCGSNQYIQSLEASIRKEMTPTYPACGPRRLIKYKYKSSRQEGLWLIHSIQQRRNSENTLVSKHTLPHLYGLCSAAPQVTIGLQPSSIPNGGGVHGNVHLNNAVGPWFNST